MRELTRGVLSSLVGVWRYRWLIVIVPALVSPIGWLYVATLPDQFESVARVFVDTEALLTPRVSGIALPLDDNRRRASMIQFLFTKDVMERLAHLYEQDLDSKMPAQSDDWVASLKSRVKLHQQSVNIYKLSFTDQSPELAMQVVQAFLTRFEAATLGESPEDADPAEQFLVSEAKDYERRLVEAERELDAFKARDLPHLSEGDHVAALQEAKARLQTARLDLEAAQDRRDELQEQMTVMEEEGLRAVRTDANIPQSPLEQRIRDLQAQVDELLVRFTERHPDVTHFRNTIEQLEKQLEEDNYLGVSGEAAFFDASQALAANSVYQQMSLLMTEAEAEVARKEASLNELQRRVMQLDDEVERMRAVETEHTRLNRNHRSIREKHNALLQQLKALGPGRRRDSAAETPRFRLIDPPEVPETPVGPNRILLSAMVLGVGFAAGSALAVIMSLIRPTYSDPTQLAKSTGVVVLGSVNMIWNEARQRRQRLVNLLFGLSILLLLLAYAVVVAVFHWDLDVLSRLPAVLPLEPQ